MEISAVLCGLKSASLIKKIPRTVKYTFCVGGGYADKFY